MLALGETSLFSISGAFSHDFIRGDHPELLLEAMQPIRWPPACVAALRNLVATVWTVNSPASLAFCKESGGGLRVQALHAEGLFNTISCPPDGGGSDSDHGRDYTTCHHARA